MEIKIKVKTDTQIIGYSFYSQDRREILKMLSNNAI